MMENLPGYVSTVFIVTTFVAVGIFLNAVKQAAFSDFSGKLIAFLIAFWIFFQLIMAQGGVYRQDGRPELILLLVLFPPFALIALYFVFFRESLIEKLPLPQLTFLHVVRLPIEFVLYWLSASSLVPVALTFNGRNYDILLGLTAPLLWIFAFRGDTPRRVPLIVWNLIGLASLVHIIITAVSDIIAVGPANRAVGYFPFIYLPTLVVPLVAFSHLIALWQLRRRSSD